MGVCGAAMAGRCVIVCLGCRELGHAVRKLGVELGAGSMAVGLRAHSCRRG